MSTNFSGKIHNSLIEETVVHLYHNFSLSKNKIRVWLGIPLSKVDKILIENEIAILRGIVNLRRKYHANEPAAIAYLDSQVAKSIPLFEEDVKNKKRGEFNAKLEYVAKVTFGLLFFGGLSMAIMLVG